MKKVKEKYTFIDLFAGLSGIRIGFEQAASDLGVKKMCIRDRSIAKSCIAS